ncbi:helix-turn-helix domain-containing protein [Kitasatospora sp. NPDC001547]|uniref:helix-turn-helix domain-containing protein n=1 Tax=Kitasatospora sp. NPDC001547 TaxID=3364015 RepID=UPI003697BDC3|nr:hypothetical protein KitaXyl93_29520 [Kitasatospora sp. Xyl93]
MPASESSHVQAARKVLADRLREMCEDAGLDGKQLAALCGWHPSKVSRISTARTSLCPPDGPSPGGDDRRGNVRRPLPTCGEGLAGALCQPRYGIALRSRKC